MAEGRGGIDNAPPKVGYRVAQTSRPGGGGFVWLGQNSEGTNVWAYNPGGHDAPKPSTTGGGGGGGGYAYGGGGGGGGGGSSSPGLSTYVQEYRIRFHADGSPPADLLSKAKNGKWSLAYFDQQVRENDKTYLSSKEAKSLLPGFNDTMKVLFPGLSDKTKEAALMKSSFYKTNLKWYLQQGIGLQQNGEELLYSRISGTRKWNAENPYWKQYAANKNAAVIAESNPVMYKNYLEALKQNFEAVGMPMSDDYYKTFFQSRYASSSGIKEMQSNLQNFAQTAGSQNWFQGSPVTHEQTKNAVLGEGIGATDLRSKMQQHFGVQSSFLGNAQQGFGVQENKQGRLVEGNL